MRPHVLGRGGTAPEDDLLITDLRLPLDSR
jgi:hypothetical protein